MSWWKNYKEEFILMLEYIEAIKKRDDLNSFFEGYRTETMIRMVFESNTIENEGLDLIGTKRLFSEIFELSIIKFESNKLSCKKEYDLIIEDIKMLIENLDITDFNNKKEFITTLNHLTLILTIDIIFRKNRDKLLDYNSIFNSENFKKFHSILSRELDNNNNGLPGNYRTDIAFIDMETIFLEPSLISEAVEKSIKDFLFKIKSGNNIYLETMLFVAKFIRIHPFGDCNGRLSRVILNLSFLYSDVPFYLILRSNSRSKKKYIEAMREFYQKKKISKFIFVVSRAVLKQVEEINDSLELVGKDRIEPLELPKDYKEKIIYELSKY
ncbi:MAG: Fic family protein [Cetobacterium sp.]|uniref:Fic family protein n=1 Tax=Bacteria TaxID=2 RepID=UPI003EE5F29E